MAPKVEKEKEKEKEKGKRVPPKSKSEMRNDDPFYKLVLDKVTEIVKPYGGFENLELVDCDDVWQVQSDIVDRLKIEIPTRDLGKLKSGAAIVQYLLPPIRAWDRRVRRANKALDKARKARNDEHCNAQRLAALTLTSPPTTLPDFKNEDADI